MKTRFARLACAAALLALSVSSATAQNYPARQITLVVPFAPGGPADFLGRLIGQKMGEDLGQQVVIDNRPGANTIIGAQAVAKAAPDGYTLLMAIDGTLVMNPFLYSKLAYDPFKDFVPVSLVALVPSAVVGNINIPVSSIKDLVEREKAKPGTFQIGISTPTSQVNVGLLNMMAGTNSPWSRIEAGRHKSPAFWPETFRSAWRASTCRCRFGATTSSRFWDL
jgi:tripartite-type tricarboxylate transporter receptor subunit TctC